MDGQQIQAVLFDLGDTLIEFGRLNHRRMLHEAAVRSYAYLKDLDQPVGSFWAYRLYNGAGIRMRLLGSVLTGNDFDSLEVLKRFGRKRGFTLSDEQWEELNWKWYEPLAEHACAEPDLRQTLETLRQGGLKLGILSNTFVHGSTLDRHLERLGIGDLFDVRMYSYQFSFRKPDSRIFLKAAAALETAPGQVMFVGDRIDKDICGALKAGMSAVLKKAYTNVGRNPPEGVPVIDRIGQLPKLLKPSNRAETDAPATALKP